MSHQGDTKRTGQHSKQYGKSPYKHDVADHGQDGQSTLLLGDVLAALLFPTAGQHHAKVELYTIHSQKPVYTSNMVPLRERCDVTTDEAPSSICTKSNAFLSTSKTSRDSRRPAGILRHLYLQGTPRCARLVRIADGPSI